MYGERAKCIVNLCRQKMMHKHHELYMNYKRNLRLVPNATYIPLPRVGGLREVKRKNLRHLTQKIPTCWYFCVSTAQNRPLFERQDRCSLFSVLCYFRYFVRE